MPELKVSDIMLTRKIFKDKRAFRSFKIKNFRLISNLYYRFCNTADTSFIRQELYEGESIDQTY